MDFTRRNFMGLGVAALASRHAVSADDAGDAIDPLDCRADFPVVENLTYLNSPYIAPSPEPVARVAFDFEHAKATDPISLGDMLGETRLARQRFAELVNADVGEIGLLSTTSEGENVVTRALELKAGDNVVIDDLHYNTTFLLYEQLSKTRGVELRIVKSVDGAAPADRFARHIDGNTRLVSVSWVSHQNGYRHDLKALAELAHAAGAYLYVDAIQGIGALPLDVRDTGVDFFAAGTYKWLLGGFGVAAFFVRNEHLDMVAMDRVGWRQQEGETESGEPRLLSDARKYGYATPAFTAVYQLRAGLDYLLRTGVERIAAHTVPLAQEANRQLREMGFRVRTPADNASAIVAFEHGADPQRAAAAFEQAGIRISLREGGTQLRAGFALFNNQDDLAAFLATARGLHI